MAASAWRKWAMAGAVSFMLAGCAGPIETRIATAIPTPPPAGAIYILSVPETPLGATEKLAMQQLEARLARHGMVRTDEAEKAQFATTLSIADRPAGMIEMAEIAATGTKKRRPRCEARDMQVAILVTQLSDGAAAYRGSASETHCTGKAAFADVMPILLEHAASGLPNAGVAGTVGERIALRPRR